MRAKKVIRLSKLSEYSGVQRSRIDQFIREGKLHPFSPTGARAKCVTEDEVAELQQAAIEEAAAQRGDAE
jgi:hypothetical protein